MPDSDMSGNDGVGLFCHTLAKELFPICRSLTGPGVRQTLSVIKQHLPGLEIHEVPSGTRVFDWTIPDEWTIRAAHISNQAGERIIDFNDHNLHLVGYSVPIDQWMELDELNEHLYSLPEQPDAIPYITSYYSKRWGFCLAHKQRQQLPQGRYHVVIDADLEPGVLNYADLIIPGKSSREVLLSTYICHPSMANNELSGPVVATALAMWLMQQKQLKYTYRIVFVPETIGSITYLSRHLQHLQEKVIAGFNLTCVGDDRNYSYLPSRDGNTLSDHAALHVLKHIAPEFRCYSWFDRGSDERQYCAPGVDLPIASIMRTKYGDYPEYHTSLDDLSLVTPTGLEGAYEAIRQAISVIENNMRPVVSVKCEPQLGKRGLYPTLGTKETGEQVADMMNMISMCDGRHSLLEIAELTGKSFFYLLKIMQPLLANGLIKSV